MLFGKLLESVNEGEENDLYDMEQDLRRGIDKVKNMASSCKISTEDDLPFSTNEAGVTLPPRRNCSTPSSRATSTTTRSSGKPTSKTNSASPSSRTCPKKHPSFNSKFKIYRYPSLHPEPPGKILQIVQTQEQEEESKTCRLNIKKFYLPLRKVLQGLRLRCLPQPPHQTQTQRRQQNRPLKTSSTYLSIQGVNMQG